MATTSTEEPAKRSTKTTTTKITKGAPDVHQKMDLLERLLPKVVISGYPDAQRAVIAKDDKDESKHRVLVQLVESRMIGWRFANLWV